MEKAPEIDLQAFAAANTADSRIDSTSDAGSSVTPTNNRSSRRLQKWQKITLALCLLVLLLLTSLLSYSYFLMRQLKQQVDLALPVAFETRQALASQNFLALPPLLESLQNHKNDIQLSYQRLGFWGQVPFLGTYYRDGEKLLQLADHGLSAATKGTQALLPYTDLLGLQGEGSFTGGTTEDRIVLILQTLEEIQPTIDEIDQELRQVASIINSIEAKRYPEQIFDHSVRSQLITAQNLLTLYSQSFTAYKPVLASLGKMAGGAEPQKYLVLFQNDNELRPTGGFLTAYAIISVNKGVVTSEKSDDIYELDKKFTKRVSIPPVLGRYLTTEKYFHLRDMNISPDFKASMDEFYANYSTVRGEATDIDGIIAVDTYVLSELLRVIGPVEVPGYGVFSAEISPRCDCPQVVYALSEIITKPTPYLRDDRKGVLGPLMKSILSKTYDLDKARFPELFQVAIKSLEGRRVQLYFMDETLQLAAEQINAAGRLYTAGNNLKGWEMGRNMDFLAIVDANLGGAKSNLFTSYEVKQTVSAPTDGYLEKTVEITYKNNRKADNCNLEAGQLCLNSTLNDWLRIYLPAGSELLEIQGISNEANTYEEGGLLVVDGYFSLEPLGLAKIRLNYKVPYTDSVTYNLRVWKQGGVDNIPMLIDVTGGEEQLLIEKDTDYSTVF